MEENNSPTIIYTSGSKIKSGVQVDRIEWVPSRHKTWKCGVIRDGQGCLIGRPEAIFRTKRTDGWAVLSITPFMYWTWYCS